MSNIISDQFKTVADQNRAYYDVIAQSYDGMMGRVDANTQVRKQVADKFISIVPAGSRVLDFGGGTGLDLEWLTAGGYAITFCEPSEKMRQQATMRVGKHPSVTVLDSVHTDFTRWDAQLPFEGRIDGILCDFAVINCIEHIGLLFECFSALLSSGGSIIALMLKHDYQKNSWQRLRQSVKYMVWRRPALVTIRFGESQQMVYLYSQIEIKRAIAPGFNIVSADDTDQFTLFHFKKK